MTFVFKVLIESWMHLQLYNNMFMMLVKSHPEMRSGKNSIMFGYVLFCHCIDMSQISIKDMISIRSLQHLKLLEYHILILVM